MMSTEPTNTDETKEVTPSQPVEDVKKLEEEASSSPTVEPGKKKRKLNDGSTSNVDEEPSSTGLFSSITNFFSGSWIWSHPVPKKTEATAKVQDKSSENDPTEPTKTGENTKEEEEAEPTATTESTTDNKKHDAKYPEKGTSPQKETEIVTNSSGYSDEEDEDYVQKSHDHESDDDNEDETEEAEQSISDTKIVVESDSPKAVVIDISGSKKRRRMS